MKLTKRDSNEDCFYQELRTLWRLRDVAGVVQPHSLIETRNHHSLVLEELRPFYLIFCSLEDVVEAIGPLVETLGTAHQRGIAHGDLKPQNIMVNAEGRLVLVDRNVSSAAHCKPEGISGTMPFCMQKWEPELGSALDSVALA